MEQDQFNTGNADIDIQRMIDTLNTDSDNFHKQRLPGVFYENNIHGITKALEKYGKYPKQIYGDFWIAADLVDGDMREI